MNSLNRSISNHITLILALISILLSIFLFNVFNQILQRYEKTIIDNYSIVIVSTKPIKLINLPLVKSIHELDIKKQIQKIKKKYKNIDFSKISLPLFYKIKLSKLPTPSELKQLEKDLLKYKFIKRVMTHSSAQTKIYNLLMLINLITKTFMIISGILGFLLIIKQLEVWKLLHSERMYIMELFGAPFWFKGATLFKIAFIDALISNIITAIIIIFIINSDLFTSVISELNINFDINLFYQFGLLFFISTTISLVSSIIVVVWSK